MKPASYSLSAASKSVLRARSEPRDRETFFAPALAFGRVRTAAFFFPDREAIFFPRAGVLEARFFAEAPRAEPAFAAAGRFDLPAFFFNDLDAFARFPAALEALVFAVFFRADPAGRDLEDFALEIFALEVFFLPVFFLEDFFAAIAPNGTESNRWDSYNETIPQSQRPPLHPARREDGFNAFQDREL